MLRALQLIDARGRTERRHLPSRALLSAVPVKSADASARQIRFVCPTIRWLSAPLASRKVVTRRGPARVLAAGSITSAFQARLRKADTAVDFTQARCHRCNRRPSGRRSIARSLLTRLGVRDRAGVGLVLEPCVARGRDVILRAVRRLRLGIVKGALALDVSQFSHALQMIGALLGGAANGQAVNPERRLADADRNALTFLAAGADSAVELHVVADPPRASAPGFAGLTSRP